MPPALYSLHFVFEVNERMSLTASNSEREYGHVKHI